MKERCRYGGPSLLPVLGWAQFHVITALSVSFTAAAADRLLGCSALLLPSYSLGSFFDLRTSASLRTSECSKRFQVPWLLAGSCRGLADASVTAPLCTYNRSLYLIFDILKLMFLDCYSASAWLQNAAATGSESRRSTVRPRLHPVRLGQV
jgi:hypothetical protein